MRKGILIIAVFFLGIIPLASAEYQTIFYEDWESGDFGNWTRFYPEPPNSENIDSDARVNNAASFAWDNYYAVLNDNAAISHSIDATYCVDNVSLSYARRTYISWIDALTYIFGTPDNFTISYRINNSNNSEWNHLERGKDGTWDRINFTSLPESSGQNIELRFFLDGHINYGLVDDINVSCDYRPPVCGDEEVNQEWEVCDNGDNNSIVCSPEYDSFCEYCSDTCQLVKLNGSFCGDNVQDIGHEECDDGNDVNDDLCTNECKAAVCGDNIIQTVLEEQCDDGNTINGDGCNEFCQVEFCGDNATQTGSGEECDNGGGNGDICAPEYANSCSYCSSECSLVEVNGSYCGDGVYDSDFEECDDANNNNNDACSNECTLTFCGDDIKQNINGNNLAEQCDGSDGLGEYQACDEFCQLVNLTYCGDGISQSPNDYAQNEECDGSDGVGEHQLCSESCTLANLTYCGDGIVQNPNDDGLEEACDNGAENTNETCNPEIGQSCSYCDLSCQEKVVESQLGEIYGMVFEDKNNNGGKDQNESGLENWTVELLKNGAFLNSTATDLNGTYWFNELLPGNYSVRQIVKQDWIQTVPNTNNDYEISLEEGEVKDDFNFGNFETFRIVGLVWEDLNGNGQKEDNDSGLGGWNVTLKKIYGNETNSSINNSYTYYLTTDENGSFSFSVSEPADYLMTAEIKEGFVQTTDKDQFKIEVNLNKSKLIDDVNNKSIEFGNHKLPLIENVKTENVGKTSATLSWSTNKETISRVLYDTLTLSNESQYKFSILGNLMPKTNSTENETLTTLLNLTNNNEIYNYSAVVEGLSPGTIYYFRIISGVTNESPYTISDEFLFTTEAEPAPVVQTSSGGGSGGGGGGGCLLKWNCTEWSLCTPEGEQTRVCENIGTCPATWKTPETEQDCDYVPKVENDKEEACEESWNCTEWSECVDGNQTRECSDANECGTSLNKPEETRTCEVIEEPVVEQSSSGLRAITGAFLPDFNNPFLWGLFLLILALVVFGYLDRKRIFELASSLSERVKKILSGLRRVF